MVNGIFKQWFNSFDQIQNSMLKHIYQDFKIAAALINCFFARNLTDRNNGVEIAKKMNRKLRYKKNPLESYLKQSHRQKNEFRKIEDSEITDFPSLCEDDIRKNITLGIYQIRQSYGYIAEHMNKTGKYNLMIQIDEKFRKSKKNCRRILKVNIQSKTAKLKKYQVFIKYVPNKNTPDAILGWICDCKNGLRTVGCCSHVASIICYLGCFRNMQNLKYTNSFRLVSTNQEEKQEENSKKQKKVKDKEDLTSIADDSDEGSIQLSDFEGGEEDLSEEDN